MSEKLSLSNEPEFKAFQKGSFEKLPPIELEYNTPVESSNAIDSVFEKGPEKVVDTKVARKMGEFSIKGLMDSASVEDDSIDSGEGLSLDYPGTSIESDGGGIYHNTDSLIEEALGNNTVETAGSKPSPEKSADDEKRQALKEESDQKTEMLKQYQAEYDELTSSKEELNAYLYRDVSDTGQFNKDSLSLSKTIAYTEKRMTKCSDEIVKLRQRVDEIDRILNP